MGIFIKGPPSDMVTRDSPSGTVSPPDPVGPASLPRSRPWLAWGTRLEKATRFLLWSALLSGTGLLLAQTASLLQPPPPRRKPVDRASVQLPEFPLLEGSWTTDDARFGLQGRLVGDEELSRSWRSMGATPLADSSPFDQEVAGLLGTRGLATETSDARVYEQVHAGLRMRGVFSGDDPPRLRLFQLAVRNGANWALGEILPSPEARVRERVQSLVPEITGKRLMRRWSADEQMTGEVVTGTPLEPKLVHDLEAGGWNVERLDSPGASIAWRIRRGSAQRLLMSLAESPSAPPFGSGSISENVEPAKGSDSPRLLLILQAAFAQEHP